MTLPERLIALSQSLVGDEWNHPITCVEDCRRAAAIAVLHDGLIAERINQAVEMAKFSEGFAWTAAKEKLIREELRMVEDHRLEQIAKKLEEEASR